MSDSPRSGPQGRASKRQLWVPMLAVLALFGTASVAKAPATAAPDPGRPPQEADPPLAAAPAADPCVDRFDHLRSRSVRAENLIVTLPDPLDTHFAREFDVMFAALTRGLGDQGFVSDRACLPWPADPKEAKASTRHETEPGVLLFRSESRVLAVLVVGETPLAGVHSAAMDEALESVRDGGAFAPRSGVGEPDRRIRILGPTFSGSAGSIHDALLRLRERIAESSGAGGEGGRTTDLPAPPPVEVTVVSPSASDHELPERLSAGLEAGEGVLEIAGVASMAVPDLLLSACLWNHFVPTRLGLSTSFPLAPEEIEALADQGLAVPDRCVPRRPGKANHRVALLVEDSAYGHLFRKNGFHVEPFPMHVWRLRELYDVHPSGPGPGKQASAAVPDLALTRSPHGVPTFGGTSTIASQDAMLTGVLGELARKRYEAIVVVASDVLDRRFLVERLGELTPGARVITFEGDVLLGRFRKGVAPTGLLVVSSYPGAGPQAFEGGAGRSADPLPSPRFPLDAAYGVYYAARRLIAAEDATSRPREAPKAVWLSVVGGGDLHTVERLPIDEVRAPEREPLGTARGAVGESGGAPLQASAVGPAAGSRIPRYRGWGLLLGVVSFLLVAAMLHVCNCLWKEAAPRPIFGVVPPELVKMRWATCESLPSVADRALHALVVLLPVFVGVPYVILSFPVLKGGWIEEELFASGVLTGLLETFPPLIVLLLVCVTLYLLLALTLRTAYDFRSAWRANGGGRPGRRWLRENAVVFLPLLVTSLLVVAGVAVVAVWVRTSSADGENLLVGRSLALGSGVSPLLPWAIFGGLLLGWIALSLYRHRVRRAIPTREELARLSDGDSDPVVRSQVCKLRRSIDPASFWQGAGVLWTLLFGAPLFYLAHYYGGSDHLLLRSVEGRVYDLVSSFLFAVAILVAVGEGISLLRGWSALRELLEWLRVRAGLALREADLLDRVGTAYGETGDSATLAERRRVDTLAALNDELRAHPEDEAARDLARRLAAVTSAGEEVPAGRWLAVASWFEAAARRPQEPPEKLRAAATEFFVWSMVRFVRDAFVQLLQLMGFMTVALVGILVAVSSYPFEPRRVLLVYVSALMAAGVSLSVVVIFQARQKKLLDAVEGHGSASWRLALGRLGVYAGLPVVTVVASRFPELRRVLLDWVAPLFKAFN